MILLATVLFGLIGLLTASTVSEVIAGLLTWPWTAAYWVAVIVSGVVTLFGIFTPKIEGLLIERAGLILQATLVALYIYSSWTALGWAGGIGIVLPAGIVAGHIARIVQCRRDLAFLKAYLAEHPGERVR